VAYVVHRETSGLERALALHRAGRLADAEGAYLAWLSTHPDDPDANFYLGGLRQQQGRTVEAVAHFQAVIARDAARAEAWLNLGVALRKIGELSGATDCLEQAIALDPASAVAHYNLGIVLQERKRPADALACLDAAIALRPGHAGTHCNRGAVLAALNRDRAAVESFERALALEPQHAIARHNLGLAQLRMGLFGEAWKNCEYRWKRPGAADYRHAALPRWHGEEPLRGKRLLLWSEQGFGDTVQFCRYAPLLAARGAIVVLEVQEPLVSLLSGIEGVSQCLAQGDILPRCDFEIPLMSVPMALATAVESIPARIPYLFADPARVASLRDVVGPCSHPARIGIACSGSPSHVNDANRSVPLAHFAPLFGRAQLYLLQKSVHARDAQILREGAVRDLQSVLADFGDTAAVIAHLDLVISVDTAVAHLAGAMGKPVWILLPFAPDWRWGQDRRDSPWYPTALLFRQRQAGDWPDVIERVAGELEGRALLAEGSR